jgi:hypothetical protein
MQSNTLQQQHHDEDMTTTALMTATTQRTNAVFPSVACDVDCPLQCKVELGVPGENPAGARRKDLELHSPMLVLHKEGTVKNRHTTTNNHNLAVKSEQPTNARSPKD